MDLKCPDCRGELQMQSARWAVCAQHGGRYEVLFDRDAVPFPAQEASGGAPTQTCEVHPRQQAVAQCGTCNKPLCTVCSFELNGRAYCSDCATSTAMTGSRLGLTASPPPARRQAVNIGACADHPDMEAVARCRLCGKAVCATCDFAMPGGVHLCPQCVEKESSSDEVSPKRKRLSYIGLALGIWATLGFVMLFAGAFNQFFTPDEAGQAADLVITNLILWPLLIGAGVSLSALDKKLRNTGLMKAVAWWNGILAGIFLLIIVAANLGLIGE